MKNLKKIFVLSLILCFFLCLSAVSAENINLSDANNISTNNQVSSDIVLSDSSDMSSIEKIDANSLSSSVSTGSIYVNSTGKSYTDLSSAVSASKENDNIIIGAGTYSGLANTNITIKHGLTITADSTNGNYDTVILDGNNNYNILTINTTSTVKLTGITFANGRSLNGGSAVYDINSNLIIDHCNFINNTATANYAYGGAIYAYNGTLKVTNSNFYNNKASYGAGISARYLTLNVTTSRFINNTVTISGGAIHSLGNSLYLYNSYFLNNQALYGTVASFDGNSIITKTTFVNNNASRGGALYTSAFNINGTFNNITYCAFINNTATTGNSIYTNYEDSNVTGVAEYCWWGSNNPSTNEIYNKGSSYTNMTYWGIMTLNIKFNSENVYEVTVSLNNYTDGNKIYNMLSLLPSRLVTLSLNNGIINSSSGYLSNNIFKTNCSNINSSAILTAKIDNQVLTSNFDVVTLTAIDFTEIYGQGQNFTGKLTDVNGNPIIGQHIALNLTRLNNGQSKVYWVTTDINGEWQLQINLATNKYTGWASFAGSNNYSAATSKIANIIVTDGSDNRTPTVLTVNNYKGISSNPGNLTGKLTTYTGTALFENFITLTLTRVKDGASKQYMITTDDNGEFQLPITLGPGNYTVQCSYAGITNYAPSSASATVNIVKG